MEPEKYFDVAFAAPGGIKRLRELTLTLAMQGKLVPQNPDDPPARELLKEIETEKKRLVKEGRIREPKPLPEIKPEEVPYELPKGWEWVRLNDLGIWKSGTTPSRQNSSFYGGDIPWVKSGEVKQGRINAVEEKITQQALDACSLDLNPIGSVLIAMYGANIGDVGILEVEATTNQAICACKPYSSIANNFLVYLLISLKQYFISQGAGAAQPNISREKIVLTVVPLPSLSEQRRIVAKIDQLMSRCDELEKLRFEREQKRLTIHTAALKRLLGAQERDTFVGAWQFIARHFGELYSVKENVAELRKSILQLAVTGKLVPQNPDDPPARELLKEIETEKKRLVKEGRIREPKPLPEIKPEDVPYELPKGWEWVRLSSLVESIDYGTSKKAGDDSSQVPVYRMGNILNGQLLDTEFKYISRDIDDLPRLYLNKNDILFNRTNSYELVGKSAIYLGQKNTATFASYLIRLRPFANNLLPIYLSKAMNAPYFRVTQIEPEIVQQCGQANFNGTKLSMCLVPLPSLPEQHRIVTKVDQLTALCDKLEEQIDSATGKRTALLNAIVAQV